MDDQKTFEGWAILELMGHRRLAGRVTEVELAGQGFLRLDIPEVDRDGEVVPAATQFYSPGAVYALTPTTEEIARAIRVHPQPVRAWELPRQALLDAAPLDVDEVEENEPQAELEVLGSRRAGDDPGIPF